MTVTDRGPTEWMAHGAVCWAEDDQATRPARRGKAWQSRAYLNQWLCATGCIKHQTYAFHLIYDRCTTKYSIESASVYICTLKRLYVNNQLVLYV